MPALTIRTVRSRFPHTRPGLARRGMGSTWLDDYATNIYAGAPWITPTVAQVQAQAAKDRLRAATNQITGVVNWDLVNAQIAESNAQIDAAYKSGELSSPPTLSLGSLSDILGIDPATFDFSTVAKVLIVGGVAVGGYYLYKAVK